MFMTTITAWKYLAPKPKSFYKQLFVNNRIQARLLYGHYRNAEEPLSPEAIAAAYNLPLEAVQEAIRYCEGNPPEIREDFAAEDALLDAEQRAAAEGRLLTPQEMVELRRR
jgi:uncharacterized protein (DUF433 family)